MQKALVAGFSALLSVATAASAMPLTFDIPGNVQADHLKVGGGQWAIVVFQDTGSTRLDVPNSVTNTNDTLVSPARVAGPAQADIDAQAYSESTSNQIGPRGVTFALPTVGESSLFIQAEDLQFEVGSVVGALEVKDSSSSTWKSSRAQDQKSGLLRPHEVSGDHAVVAIEPSLPLGSPFTIRANSTYHVEWYNLSPSCTQEEQDCPGQGGLWKTQAEGPGGYRISSERRSYESLTGPMGELEVSGRLAYLAIGGATLDVDLDGALRLPIASGDGGCPSCLSPQDQTLAVSGNVRIGALSMAPDGRLQGDLSGEFESARLDETAIDPATIFGIGVVVAAGAAVASGIVLVKSLLLPFVTRLKEQDALTHPRRRTILEYVHAHPGANVSEVVQATGIASGSLRHHLAVLRRAGQLVERPHGGTIRLFENHGKFDSNWGEVVLLRQPPLAKVHTWLKEHPQSTQRAIIEGLHSADGWNRSTIQHRLNRLVAGGLVSVRLQGRLKIYSVNEQASHAGRSAKQKTAGFA